MEPLPIIELEIFAKHAFSLRRGFVILQVRFFVFDAVPEPSDEDVIQGSVSPVHADGVLAFWWRKRFNSHLFSLK
jgi:hypothetical protein